eukprot:scaffold91896_cov51-Attheya_sp.AAC.3
MVHLRISSLALAILCSLALSSASESESKDALRWRKANEKYAVLGDPNLAPLRSEFHLWADVNSKAYESKDELARRMVVWMDNHGTFTK